MMPLYNPFNKKGLKQSNTQVSMTHHFKFIINSNLLTTENHSWRHQFQDHEIEHLIGLNFKNCKQQVIHLSIFFPGFHTTIKVHLYRDDFNHFAIFNIIMIRGNLHYNNLFILTIHIGIVAVHQGRGFNKVGCHEVLGPPSGPEAAKIVRPWGKEKQRYICKHHINSHNTVFQNFSSFGVQLL